MVCFNLMTNDEYTVLMTSNKGLFYAYARRMCNNASNVEDLVQETMIKFYEKKDTFDEGKKAFNNYVYTMMKNIFIDKKRSDKRNIFNGNSELSDFDVIHVGTNGTLNNIHRKDIIKLFKLLKPYYEQILFMRMRGYTYKEIALKHEVNISQVKAHVYAARKELKSLIQTLT